MMLAVNIEEYRKISFWNMLIILSLLHGCHLLLSLLCFMLLNYYNVIVTDIVR